MQAAGSRKTSAPDFLICGNSDRRSSTSEGGDRMIREKIDAILDKMSEAQLTRAYEYLKFIYVYR